MDSVFSSMVMPTRRSYLATLCSGAVLLAGCSAREDDEERKTPGDETETPPTDESGTPPGDEPPTDDGETAPGTGTPEDDYLDIRDHGAAVDGRADDTHAIRDAILSASEGDTILIPEGTTVVSTEGVEEQSAIYLNAADIPRNLTITGRGKQSTIKLADNQQRGSKLLRLTGTGSFNNLLLTQFRIDGNKRNQSTSGGHGIRVDNSHSVFEPADVRFQHLWVDSCNQTGISLWRGGITVTQTTVRRCSKHGISIGEAGERSENIPGVIVSHSLCEQNGKDGEGLTYGINCSGGNVLVTHCVARNNAQGTKTTDNTIETTYHRVRLENNDHNGYIRAGEDSSTRSRVSFIDVVSRANGEAGFRLSRDTDYVIPTQILARANNGNNITLTNDASLDAEVVWSNNADNAYGIASDSIIGGKIRYYHPYKNGNGPLEINNQLSIVNIDYKNKRDIQAVPKAPQVGAGSSPFSGRSTVDFLG